MTASGWWRGGELERLLAGGGEVDVVAAGAEVDGQRPQDRRLVVDDEDALLIGHATGRPITIVVPPPGRVVDLDRRRPSPSRKPRATASPSPTPVPGSAVAEALERLEDALAGRGGMPGPWSTTRSSTPLADRAGLDPDASAVGG